MPCVLPGPELTSVNAGVADTTLGREMQMWERCDRALLCLISTQSPPPVSGRNQNSVKLGPPTVLRCCWVPGDPHSFGVLGRGAVGSSVPAAVWGGGLTPAILLRGPPWGPPTPTPTPGQMPPSHLPLHTMSRSGVLSELLRLRLENQKPRPESGVSLSVAPSLPRDKPEASLREGPEH